MVYEGCLCHELVHAGIGFARQARIPVFYKGVRFEEGFRADVLVDGQLVVEIRAVAGIVPMHEAPILSYLRMSGLSLDLLFDFHARMSEFRGAVGLEGGDLGDS